MEIQRLGLLPNNLVAEVPEVDFKKINFALICYDLTREHYLKRGLNPKNQKEIDLMYRGFQAKIEEWIETGHISTN